MQIQGAAALVTGGASGLGEATVRTLTEAGATVTIVDRDEAKAKALAAELGGGTRYAVADVADVEQVQAAVQVREDPCVASDIPRTEQRLHLGPVQLLEDQIGSARIVQRRHRIPVSCGVAEEVGLLRRRPAIFVPAEHAAITQIEDVGVAAAGEESHRRSLDVLPQNWRCRSWGCSSADRAPPS